MRSGDARDAMRVPTRMSDGGTAVPRVLAHALACVHAAEAQRANDAGVPCGARPLCPTYKMRMVLNQQTVDRIERSEIRETSSRLSRITPGNCSRQRQ